ncbi:hypothetical protein C8K30_11586 [Promicromonospora sp. AC04]|uniref:hypothetical protein n=1 Tax=Promicromonospora sp. AC04 TaxID=2135723 RepID=UPI000D373285|nr:hypothetical protein [Promicromonospora sp. AC04]PUB20875.1 hypothetical protein C8K30_11586 [Promicromonospora sp. AC04]
MTSNVRPTPSPSSQDEGTPEDVARKAVAAVLDLHIATTGPLEPASLPTVTREVQTLALLLGDVAQDLKLFSQRYSLDSGGIEADQNDLRTQARVTGASATRKFVEAVELLYQASSALAQAQDDTSLMADLSSSSPQTTPSPTNRDRTPDPGPAHPGTVDRPDDSPSL